MNPTSQNTANKTLSFCVGISIINYLNPFHTQFGYDFFVNSFSFLIIALGLGYYFYLSRIKYYSLSIFTWLALSVLIIIQPILNYIKYPDGLIFPSICLILISLMSIASINITNKKSFLNRLSYFIYIMALTTFCIQLMQIMDMQISYHGWAITLLKSLPDRMDGNFAQANHTGYAFILAICFVLYQFQECHYKKTKILFLGLLIVFSIGISLTKSRAALLMALSSIFLFNLLQPKTKKYRFINICLYMSTFIIAYFGGGFLLGILTSEKINALAGVSRIHSQGMFNSRLSMSYRALRIFMDNSLTGVGWNNFSYASIPYAEYLNSYELSINAHMFLMQIASELGVVGLLCLVPATLVILKSLHLRHSPESALSLTFVLASIIYSSLE